MKKILTKVMCLLLSLFCLLPLIMSCGGNKNDNKSTDANAENTGNLDEGDGGGDGKATEYQFPDENYNGYEFGILNLDDDEVHWAITTMVIEEEEGDTINDAIYTRNAIVEEKLNIKIKQTYKATGNIQSEVKKAVSSGSDEYDVAFMYSHNGGTASSSGYYLNLNNISTLQLDKPYWDSNAKESFEIAGKLYFMTTDAQVMTNDSLWVIYYNKQMAKDLGLADPYPLVREGKWTMDKMLEMARTAIADLDGNGKYTANNDRWGITSHSVATGALLRCGGYEIIKKSDNGIPELIYPDERMVNVYNQTRLFLDKTNGMFLEGTGNTTDATHMTTRFLNGSALFCTECLSHARRFRSMENDFGIIPHPKYDEAQSTYYTMYVDTVPMFGIPTTSPDPEKVGVIMDAMTAVSAYTIIPAYYDVSLYGKATRDEDSWEMLDIIRANRIFDLSVVYAWGGFFGGLQTYAFSTSGNNPTTYYEKNLDKTNSAIQKTIEKFEMNDD